ncbi:MAG: DUF998 domain-containing protein [Candidatus Heimdallarchaeota archaeon]
MQSVTPTISEKENGKLKTQKFLHGLIITIAPILVFTIVLAWIFYPERYYFFQEYVSQLGKLTSANGIQNLTSLIIFSTGFCICGALFLVIAIIYFVKKELGNNILKGIFSLIMAVGAVLTAIPAGLPIYGILHGIGAALFIAGFGILNFILQMIRFTRKHQPLTPQKNIGFYRDLGMTIVVFIALLIFAIFYSMKVITSSPVLQILAQTSQKLILIVNCIAIFFIDTDDM